MCLPSYPLMEVHTFLVDFSPSHTCFSREWSSCRARLFSTKLSLTEFTCIHKPAWVFEGRYHWCRLLYIVYQGLIPWSWDDILLQCLYFSMGDCDICWTVYMFLVVRWVKCGAVDLVYVNPGDGCMWVVVMLLFVKISNSWCRSWRLVYTMGTSGLIRVYVS